MRSDHLFNFQIHSRALLRNASWARSGSILAALLVLPFVLFWGETLGLRAFYHHDLQYYFLPYHKLVVDITASGNLPLWNPYTFSGISLLGDGQTAIFYPPNWLFWLLPPGRALTLAIISHFSIAGAGVFLFVRTLRLSRLAAVVAALAFMFNGYLVARVVHPSIMAGAALVPLVFWSVERLLQGGGRRAFVIAAIVVACQALAGHPQVPIYTAIGLGVYVLTIAAQHWHRTHDRAAAWLLLKLMGVYLAGYAFAAIQLIPWVELGTFSPRASGISYQLVADPIAGLDWLLFLFPYGYGGMQSSWLQSDPTWATAVYAWEHMAYIGLLPLALAGIGLAEVLRYARLTKASGEATNPTASFHCDRLRATALTLLVLLLIAMGWSTPFGRLIYLLPAVGKLRGYLRAIGVACFPLVVLAAYGVERLRTSTAPRQKGRDRAAIRCGALLLGGVGSVLLVSNLLWTDALGRALPEPMGDMFSRFLRIGQANAYVPLALAVASAATLWWLSTGLARAKAAVLLGLTAFDLMSFAAVYNPTIDPAVLERVPPSVAFLRRDPALFRVASFIDHYSIEPDIAQDQLAISWSIAYGIEEINGFNSLQPRRYTDMLFGSQFEDVSYGFLGDATLLQPQNPLLSMLNVKYALVQQHSPVTPDPSWARVYNDNNVTIYQNPQPSARAYFVDQVAVQPDWQAILARLKQPDFQPTRAAMVESDLTPEAARHLDGDTSAWVEVERVSPNELRIHTRTTAERFLVLSEMWFPGWHAEIKGDELPIYRANYLFRGLAVPAGEHTIQMYYRPLSAIVGAIVSALTALAFLIMWVTAGLKRRPPWTAEPKRSAPEQKGLRHDV
ncbi:MAG: YfhO family protein [Roseiflexaceae bacterium]